MDKNQLINFINTCFDAVEESKIKSDTLKEAIVLSLITSVFKSAVVDPPFTSKVK